MAAESNQAPEERSGERLPWQQAMFDDVFLLVFLGVVVPTLFYVVWGLLELASVSLFTP